MNFGRRTLLPLLAAFFGTLALAASAQQFAQPTVVPTGNWPSSLQTADLNSDGKPDLLYLDSAAASQHTTLRIFLNNGNGTFTLSSSSIGLLQAGDPGMPGASVYAAGDFRGTGHPDIVTFADITPGANKLQIYTGVGDGTFVASGNLSPLAGYAPQSVPRFTQAAAVRLTLAGPLGFVAEDDNNQQILIASNDGTGHFTLQTTLSLAATGPGPFLATDLNNDGITDIVVPGKALNALTIFFGRGDGTFTPGVSYAGSGAINSLLVRDVSGDHIPDVFIEGDNGAISLMEGSAINRLSPPITLTGAQDGTTGNGGHLIAIADLNGDGIPDILTSTPAGISVLLGQAGTTPSYKLLGIYNAGPGRGSYALADFNNDGYLDLAVDSPRGIAILYGRADGSFATSRSFATGAPAYALAAGQFTGSGHQDVVVATGTPKLQLLAGDGLGGFTISGPPSPAATPRTNSSRTLWSTVAAGDFDADGKLDVAVTQAGALAPSPATLSLLFGNGSGTFSAPVPLVQLGAPAFGASAVGDFNADNAGDVANAQALACDVFAGGTASRTGTMPSLPLSFTVTPNPYSLIATGYLKSNHTGKQDILCGLNGKILVYKNNGDGTFSNTSNLDPPPIGVISANAAGALPSTGYFPSALLLADLDGDGFGDVIVVYHNLASDPRQPSSLTHNAVYIYWGAGDGTFTPFSSTGDSPTLNAYMAAVADINGDGVPDLILSDGYELEVQHFSNRLGGPEDFLLAGMGINGIATTSVNGVVTPIVANGGAVFSNPAVNRGTLASNAEVDTGAITVLLPTSAHLTTTPTGTLTATPGSPGYSHSFTLTATLMPASPAPTGTVDFAIDGVTVASAVPLANGVAAYTVAAPTLAVGAHSLTAHYSGDTTYAAIDLAATLNVTLLPSQTYMDKVATPIHYGEIIGDIAEGHALPLDPGDGATLDGGALTFYIDGTLVCTLTIITGPTQYCPATTGAGYSAGTYTISAMYGGNQFYSASSSVGYPVQILPDDTSGALNSSANPAPAGTPVQISAVFTSAIYPPTGNVNAPFATPAGTVTFFDGATAIGSANLNAGGTATLTTSTLAVGTHPITATLASSLNFNGSTTAVVQQVITPLVIPPVATVTALTSSLNPSNVGQQVTFAAAVTPVSGGGVPTGSITFNVDGAFIGTVTLNAQGIATINVGNFTAGGHILSASYSGTPTATTPGYLPSAATLVQQVNAVATPTFTLIVTPSALSVPIGNAATALVTVIDINGFSQPVTLACGNLPRGVTCAFDVTTIPAGGGSTHLAVTAAAPHDCTNNAPYFVSSGPTGWLGLLASSALIVLLRRRRRLIGALVVTLALCILPATIGCGHCTDLGVYPGAYTFTVTATTTTPTAITATQTIPMKAHL